MQVLRRAAGMMLRPWPRSALASLQRAGVRQGPARMVRSRSIETPSRAVLIRLHAASTTGVSDRADCRVCLGRPVVGRSQLEGLGWPNLGCGSGILASGPAWRLGAAKRQGASATTIPWPACHRRQMLASLPSAPRAPGGPEVAPGVGWRGSLRCLAERGTSRPCCLCKHPGAGDRSPRSPVRGRALPGWCRDCLVAVGEPAPGLQQALGRGAAGSTRLIGGPGAGACWRSRGPKADVCIITLICAHPFDWASDLLCPQIAKLPCRCREGRSLQARTVPRAPVSPNFFHGFHIRSPSQRE